MDENRPDNIDKLFKDSLQSSQPEPSKEMWENIERELDSNDQRDSYIRFRFVYLISACLLALVACLWLLSSQSHREITHPSGKSSPMATEKSNTKSEKRPTREARPGSIGLGYLKPATFLNNDMETASRSEKVTQIDDTKFYPSATVLSAHALTQGPLRLATVKTEVEQPDPNRRLLTDRLNSFKKINVVKLPHRRDRWAITGYYSKEFAGYNLADHDSLAANGREVDKKEKPVYSASAVLLVNYSVSRKWILQSGVSYSWSSSLANPTTSYAVNNNGQINFKVNTVSGYGYLPASPSSLTQIGDSVVTGKSFTKLHYLSMPFIVLYKFPFKKVTLMAGMGFTANLLTSAKLETKLQGPSYSQNEVEVNMYGLKRMNYGVLAKVEVQYPVYRNWSLDLVASFKNTLTPINLHTVISTYPYNLGIGLGISHTF